MWSLRLALLSALLVACQPVEPVPVDAGRDAPELPDVPPADAPVCDVAPVPADLPAIEGHFAVRAEPDAGIVDGGDADGGLEDGGVVDGGVMDGGVVGVVPPEPMGGDPTGTWVFDRVTFYSGPGTAGAYDTNASTLTGTAWASLDGTAFRLELRFDISLVTFIAGTVRRASETRVRGSYVVDGASLTVTAACADGVMSGTSGGGFSFTAEGDRGTFFTTVDGMLGEILIVLEGTRRS